MSADRHGFFVTGTDTGIGKTHVALVLMALLRSEGFRVLGMKPVATGCNGVDGVLCNDDAVRLRRAGSCAVPYAWVNPYAFEPAVAPNIAAELAGRRIDLGLIEERYRFLRCNSDRVVVEGVGGWEVPLNDRERVSDLARQLELPVVLVVGLRLGCLNHAMLSERSILASGVAYHGWCVNTLYEDFAYAEENIRTLRASLSGRFRGVVPYGPDDAGTGANLGFFLGPSA